MLCGIATSVHAIHPSVYGEQYTKTILLNDCAVDYCTPSGPVLTQSNLNRQYIHYHNDDFSNQKRPLSFVFIILE